MRFLTLYTISEKEFYLIKIIKSYHFKTISFQPTGILWNGEKKKKPLNIQILHKLLDYEIVEHLNSPNINCK